MRYDSQNQHNLHGGYFPKRQGSVFICCRGILRPHNVRQGKRRSQNGKVGEEPARDAGGERLAGASEPA